MKGVWGLTGGIAAGKSTVARLIARAGLPVLDADEIARELSSPGGAAATPILERFGTLDRSKLREIVFQDEVARRDLEAILHPLIRAESERRIAAIARPGVPVVYEAALLVETGRYRELDGLIVVRAGRAARLRRLIARGGISAATAERILDAQGAQVTDAEREAAADELLTNDGSQAELRAQVDRLVAKRGWRP